MKLFLNSILIMFMFNFFFLNFVQLLSEKKNSKTKLKFNETKNYHLFRYVNLSSNNTEASDLRKNGSFTKNLVNNDTINNSNLEIDETFSEEIMNLLQANGIIKNKISDQVLQKDEKIILNPQKPQFRMADNVNLKKSLGRKRIALRKSVRNQNINQNPILNKNQAPAQDNFKQNFLASNFQNNKQGNLVFNNNQGNSDEILIISGNNILERISAKERIKKINKMIEIVVEDDSEFNNVKLQCSTPNKNNSPNINNSTNPTNLPNMNNPANPNNLQNINNPTNPNNFPNINNPANPYNSPNINNPKNPNNLPNINNPANPNNQPNTNNPTNPNNPVNQNTPSNITIPPLPKPENPPSNANNPNLKKIEQGFVLMRNSDVIKKGVLGLMASGQGLRESFNAVKFKVPFTEIPKIFISLSYMDSPHTVNVRLSIDARNVTQTGFIAAFSTWSDSKVFAARANWIAYEDSNEDVKYILTPESGEVMMREDDVQIRPSAVGNMWKGKGLRESKALVKFTKQYIEPPKILVGFYLIHTASVANHRFSVSARSIKKERFDYFFSTWGDSSNHSGLGVWLALGQVKETENLPYKLESGIIEMDPTLGFNNGQLGIMAQGFGKRVAKSKIYFNKTFQETPNVVISISYLDLDFQEFVRISVEAKDITPEGFEADFGTWSKSKVYGARANWIAYGI